MMNIVAGKGVFIHYYFESVLLLWTKLLFRWVVCVYVCETDFFFTMCIKSPLCASNASLKVHNH